ncbi:hypothetical protein [Neomesorhizobium albiziae]|uniref:hypothetical protein n=1 Tax=Neomesorhizobium albiziae TaxID=335020 RepID=UPI00165ED93C|nr:hypothetical protein [Mesorhizobium albiziae]
MHRRQSALGQNDQLVGKRARLRAGFTKGIEPIDRKDASVRVEWFSRECADSQVMSRSLFATVAMAGIVFCQDPNKN